MAEKPDTTNPSRRARIAPYTPALFALIMCTYSARSDRDQPSNARAALASSGVMRVASLIVAGVEVFRGDRARVGRLAQRLGEQASDGFRT